MALPPRDVISIDDLIVRMTLGVDDWERKDLQDVHLHLRLWTDSTRAAQTDDIADAVNYRTVTKAVIALAESGEFYLVEKLADAIARLLITEFALPRVQVHVEKPGALRFARSVALTIEREAADYA